MEAYGEHTSARAARVTGVKHALPDPYLPVDGHLELREDRPGWGVTIDEDALRASDTIVWNRALHVRPDGSWAWA